MLHKCLCKRLHHQKKSLKIKLVPVSAMLPGCYLVVCLTSSAGGPSWANIIVKVSVVAVNYTVCAFEFAQTSLGMNGTDIAGK